MFFLFHAVQPQFLTDFDHWSSPLVGVDRPLAENLREINLERSTSCCNEPQQQCILSHGKREVLIFSSSVPIKHLEMYSKPRDQETPGCQREDFYFFQEYGRCRLKSESGSLRCTAYGKHAAAVLPVFVHAIHRLKVQRSDQVMTRDDDVLGVGLATYDCDFPETTRAQ